MEGIMGAPQTQSVVEKQKGLVQVSWEGISEPGAYVETQTGRLFRIPAEALLAGSSPLIRQSCNEVPTYIQLSKSPYISVFEARMLAAEHNVEPRF
jgi:hypothetical protein